MKKTLLGLMALACLMACNKNTSDSASMLDESRNGLLCVSVSPGVPTKTIAASTDENMIKTLQVFIFNASTGKKETDKYVENLTATTTYTLQMTSLVGNKHIWAIANAPKIVLPKDAQESTLAKKISNLGENAPDALCMAGVANAGAAGIGEGFGPLTAGNTPVNEYFGTDESLSPVSISLYHLGARVSLANVTVDFSDNNLKGATFEIKEIYLKNVVNVVNFDGSDPTGMPSTASYWTNKLRANDSAAWRDSATPNNDVKQLLYSSFTSLSNTAGASAITLNVGHNWYVYPNSSNDANLAPLSDGTDNPTWTTWSPRHTRLVIHAVVNGGEAGLSNQDTYYSFSIPQAPTDHIIANHTYDIETIKITMLGKDDDNSDKPTLSGKANITVNVQPWVVPAHTLNPEI